MRLSTPNAQTIKYTVYTKNDVSHQENIRLLPKLYKDLNDFISQKDLLELRNSLISKRDHLSIKIFIPTFNSHSWICNSIAHLEDQITTAIAKQPDWKIELVIVVNGFGQDLTINKITQIQKKNKNVSWELTVLSLHQKPNKVRAMNASGFYANKYNTDIIVFMDDDVRFTDNTFFTCVNFLLDSQEVYITGAMNWPIKEPSLKDGMFAKFEYKWEARPKTTPKGKNQYLFAKTFPYIPEYIVNDDNYILSYFSMPDCDSNILKRIKLTPNLKVYFKLVGNSKAFFKRMERIYMGREQTVSIFGDVKSNAIKARVARTKMFSFKELLTDLTAWQKIKMIFIVNFACILLFKVRIKVRFLIKIRSLLGTYPYKSKWNASITTKPEI